MFYTNYRNELSDTYESRPLPRSAALHYKAPFAELTGVGIFIADPAEILAKSVAEIHTSQHSNEPAFNTLSDLRMSPSDSRHRCLTCGHHIARCQGHIGHISLALPSAHALFLDKILKTLECICHFCSRLLIQPDDKKWHYFLKISDPVERLNELAKYCKKKEYCGALRRDDTANCDLSTINIHGGCGNRQPLYFPKKKNKLYVLCYERETPPKAVRGQKGDAKKASAKKKKTKHHASLETLETSSDKSHQTQRAKNREHFTQPKRRGACSAPRGASRGVFNSSRSASYSASYGASCGANRVRHGDATERQRPDLEHELATFYESTDDTDYSKSRHSAADCTDSDDSVESSFSHMTNASVRSASSTMSGATTHSHRFPMKSKRKAERKHGLIPKRRRFTTDGEESESEGSSSNESSESSEGESESEENGKRADFDESDVSSETSEGPSPPIDVEVDEGDHGEDGDDEHQADDPEGACSDSGESGEDEERRRGFTRQPATRSTPRQPRLSMRQVKLKSAGRKRAANRLTADNLKALQDHLGKSAAAKKTRRTEIRDSVESAECPATPNSVVSIESAAPTIDATSTGVLETKPPISTSQCEASNIPLKEPLKTKAKFTYLTKEENKKSRIPLAPQDIRDIFCRVSPEDAKYMGFGSSRPEWMLLTVLPVAPPSMRMTVHSGEAKHQTDLTTHLTQIIRQNQTLKKNLIKLSDLLVKAGKTAPPRPVDPNSYLFAQLYDDVKEQKDIENVILKIQNESNNLSMSIAGMFNAETGIPLPQTDARRHCKSICLTLSKKHGLIRESGASKRVDECARGVIVEGHLDLDVTEIGVPLYVCKTVTRPIKATDRNIEELQMLVARGPDNYPGANMIERQNGEIVDLNSVQGRAEIVRIGDTVLCHLRKGDVVLFNRHPSLHASSIMAHFVHPVSGWCFKLPSLATIGYHADFDGDEMNLHVPQTEEARTEALQIMLSSLHILRGAVAPIQDLLLFSYLITAVDNITVNEFHHLVAQTRYTNVWLKKYGNNLPEPKGRDGCYTGRQLISLLLPANFYYAHKDVLIENGELISGRLTKSTFGSSSESLVRKLALDQSVDQCVWFLSDINRISAEWLHAQGFSVSVGDNADPETRRKIRRTVKYWLNRIEAANVPITTEVMAKFAARIKNMVDPLIHECIEKSGSPAYDLVQSGAKTTRSHIEQINGPLGPVTIENKLPSKMITDRILPCFKPGCNSLQSQGYIANSLLDGLTSSELYAHISGTRVSNVALLAETPKTGYTMRQMHNAFEDITIDNSLLVMGPEGNAVALLSGGDGFSPLRLERQTHRFLKKSAVEIINEVYLKMPPEFHQAQKEEVSKILADVAWIRNARLEENCGALKAEIHTAVDCNRLLMQFRTVIQAGKPIVSPSTYFRRMNEFEALVLRRVHYRSQMRYFLGMVRSNIYYRRVYELGFDEETFNTCMDRLTEKFYLSLNESGYPIGSDSAQEASIFMVQRTLDKRRGGILTASESPFGNNLDRLKEVVCVVKNPKLLAMTIFFEPELKSEQEAQLFASKLPGHQFLDVVVKTSFETAPLTPQEKWLMNLVEFKESEEFVSGWVRLELNRAKMISLNLEPKDFVRRMREYIPPEYAAIVHSPTCLPLWWVYVRVRRKSGIFKRRTFCRQKGVSKTLEEDVVATRLVTAKLKSHYLVGLRDIQAAWPVKQKVIRSDPRTLALTESEIWVIKTNGSNLVDVLALPGVDTRRTYTNDIRQLASVLGIGAARTIMLREIHAILESNDIYIPPHYIHTVVHGMSCTGKLVPPTRSGFARLPNVLRHWLFLSAFEETVKNLKLGAFRGVIDDMHTHGDVNEKTGQVLKGVRYNNSSVIMGKYLAIGTRGPFDAVVAPEALQYLQNTPVERDAEVILRRCAQGLQANGVLQKGTEKNTRDKKTKMNYLLNDTELIEYLNLKRQSTPFLIGLSGLNLNSAAQETLSKEQRKEMTKLIPDYDHLAISSKPVLPSKWTAPKKVVQFGMKEFLPFVLTQTKYAGTLEVEWTPLPLDHRRKWNTCKAKKKRAVGEVGSMQIPDFVFKLPRYGEMSRHSDSTLRTNMDKMVSQPFAVQKYQQPQPTHTYYPHYPSDTQYPLHSQYSQYPSYPPYPPYHPPYPAYPAYPPYPQDTLSVLNEPTDSGEMGEPAVHFPSKKVRLSQSKQVKRKKPLQEMANKKVKRPPKKVSQPVKVVQELDSMEGNASLDARIAPLVLPTPLQRNKRPLINIGSIDIHEVAKRFRLEDN